MKRKPSVNGFSIPEAVIAMGIGAIAVAGGMTMNQEQLRMVKSTRQTSSSSLLLEERVEQLRIANWRQITDAAYIKDTYYKAASKSATPLPSYVEHISITAFPDSSACTPIELERNEDGSIRTISNGAGFTDQRLARITVGVSWKGNNKRTRTAELATIISNSGISRMNLPSLGAGLTGTVSTSTTGAIDSTLNAAIGTTGSGTGGLITDTLTGATTGTTATATGSVTDAATGTTSTVSTTTSTAAGTVTGTVGTALGGLTGSTGTTSTTTTTTSNGNGNGNGNSSNNNGNGNGNGRGTIGGILGKL